MSPSKTQSKKVTLIPYSHFLPFSTKVTPKQVTALERDGKWLLSCEQEKLQFSTGPE
jgi:hypothetical protein